MERGNRAEVSAGKRPARRNRDSDTHWLRTKQRRGKVIGPLVYGQNQKCPLPSALRRKKKKGLLSQGESRWKKRPWVTESNGVSKGPTARARNAPTK